MAKQYLKNSRYFVICTISDAFPKLFIACILLLSYPLQALANNEKDLELLRYRIQALQQNLTNAEASKIEAADALQNSERAISNSNRILKKLAHEKQLTVNDLNRLRNLHKQTIRNIEMARAQLGKLIYQQYVSGQQDFLRLLFNQQNPNNVARNAHYYRYLSLARSKHMSTLGTELKTLEGLTRTRQQKMEELATIHIKHAAQNKRLKQEKIKRQTILSEISGQITQQQTEVAKLKRDEKRLFSLTRKINKLLTQQNTPASLYNNQLPDDSQANLPFKSLKGRLRLPVRGKLINRFGGQRSGGQVTWEGLFIHAPIGNDVKAIANGRIVFSDWLRGFGNLMIVDHGDSYMSLYSNNETLYKEVGDIIQGGDTIATVGNSGGNIDSGLYFELRHQGKPFDPLTWIKIE